MGAGGGAVFRIAFGAFSLADYYARVKLSCRLLHTTQSTLQITTHTQSTLQITTHHTTHLADYYTHTNHLADYYAPHNPSCRLLLITQPTLQITTHHTFIAITHLKIRGWFLHPQPFLTGAPHLRQPYCRDARDGAGKAGAFAIGPASSAPAAAVRAAAV